MPYIAKIEIGGYKPGEEVPVEKAVVWAGMYVNSPVEYVGEIAKPEIAKPVEEAELPVVDSSNVEEKPKGKYFSKKK